MPSETEGVAAFVWEAEDETEDNLVAFMSLEGGEATRPLRLHPPKASGLVDCVDKWSLDLLKLRLYLFKHR